MTGMELEDPVKAIREISHDPTLNKKSSSMTVYR